MIYLDYMATTPVDPAVADSMAQCLTQDGIFGNPASQTHSYGFQAAEHVQQARIQVAALIQADPREIIWTSGATESNNLAIIGGARFYQRRGRHIITMRTEHQAVLDPCRYLLSEGFETTYLEPEKNGLLNLDKLRSVIRKDTVLISIMHVNNETGVIQDIAAIGQIARQQGVLLHVDAAQSAGKIAIDLKNWPIDLMSLSSHKLYGPKGIGALFVRRSPRVRLTPLIYGGGHEWGLRSGTLPTHQIVGMGKAYEISQERWAQDAAQLNLLRDRFYSGLNCLDGMTIHGDAQHKIPSCFNIYFDGVDSESLITRLPQLAISRGSACSAGHAEPSHVLLAMGLSRKVAANSLRISFGRFTTPIEIDTATAAICKQVTHLRCAQFQSLMI